ncbi:hypothetical protein [Rubrivivax gelatinosus]|uniref:Uncharacterized protein n=1 Tax=Rubrivivax gelatinosus (strain NBRC 100245 / IL144) TaxID=983917 RepID=I0HTR2_RUBGI|nr:hypothetical protein [Rubrivivax gelatinosus]BAL96399.1 hypothetical protein RGE_30600 [Rubrivivax gelatinosus IL144]
MLQLFPFAAGIAAGALAVRWFQRRRAPEAQAAMPAAEPAPPPAPEPAPAAAAKTPRRRTRKTGDTA